MKMNPVSLDPWTREDVYNGIVHPLVDAVVWFVFEAGVRNIVAQIHFSYGFAHAAVFRFMEID